MLSYVKQTVGICGVTQGAEAGVCDNQEEWDGAGGSREAQQGGDICVPVADSC